jgi:predicted DNA binding CopG/RHH family protein
MSKEIREIGKARRDKAVAMAMKRKEEYLGARVPKELRDRVVAKAKEIGIPVSILIRNILEDAFGEEAGQAVGQHKPATKPNESLGDKFSAVIGWESIELNKTVLCSGCGVELKQGTKAGLGLGALEPIVICDACKGRLQQK